LVLPNKSDPDEFIRQQGVSEYQRLRGNAQTHIQFVIDQATADRNLHRPAEKAAAVEEVLPYLRAVRNRIQKREYFDIAVDALRVDDSALKRELWFSIRSGLAPNDLKRKIVGEAKAKPTVAEQQLLELLFADERLRKIFLPQLTADVIADLPTEPIFEALVEADKTGSELDYDDLIKRTEGNAAATELVPRLLLLASTTLEEQANDGRRFTAEKCLETLRLMKVDRRIDELKSELAAAERNEDPELVTRLVIEQIELTRQRALLLPRAEVVANLTA
jgi:DNA primase